MNAKPQSKRAELNGMLDFSRGVVDCFLIQGIFIAVLRVNSCFARDLLGGIAVTTSLIIENAKPIPSSFFTSFSAHHSSSSTVVQAKAVAGGYHRSATHGHAER